MKTTKNMKKHIKNTDRDIEASEPVKHRTVNKAKKTLLIVLGFIAFATIISIVFGLLTNSKEFVKEPTGESTIILADKSFDVTADSFPGIVNSAFEDAGFKGISEDYKKDQVDFIVAKDDTDDELEYSIDWYVYKNDDVYIVLGIREGKAITIEVIGEYDNKETESEYYKAICGCVDSSFDCESFLQNRLISNYGRNGVWYTKKRDVIPSFEDIDVYELRITIDDEYILDTADDYVPEEMIGEDW